MIYLFLSIYLNYTEIENNPKINLEPQKPQVAKSPLNKGKLDIILPDFKIHYKATVTKQHGTCIKTE